MFHRILVPTDFSAPSDAALELARVLGHSGHGSLHLLHVTTEVLASPHAKASRNDRPPAPLKQLRDCLTGEDRALRPTVRLVERADPAAAIVSYAQASGIDLIVMGTHGRDGVAHLLMGSVAEKVVRTAPCPVLTVRGQPRGARTGFTRILVPTDFSHAADAALDCARLLAARFGVPVHLLHVLEDPPIEGPFGSEVFVSESPEIRAARLKDARERLSHRVSARDRQANTVTTEVIFGPTATTIANYAADNEFDLIVMGTHGRTGLAHLFMGSVAERVARTATCPVMSTRELGRTVSRGADLTRSA